jgi:predicted nucleotidyltransferase
MADAKLDLCYIRYFPKIAKYISLYNNGENNPSDGDEGAENRSQIKECIREYLTEKHLLPSTADQKPDLDRRHEAELTRRLYSTLSWLEKRKWNRIVSANRPVYEMLGMDWKRVLKDRLESAGGEDVDVAIDGHQSADDDDFFTSNQKAEGDDGDDGMQQSVSMRAIKMATVPQPPPAATNQTKKRSTNNRRF